MFIIIKANLSNIGLGAALAWTSPSVPRLRDTDLNTNPLGRIPSIAEESWISSLLPLGALIGNKYVLI